MRRHFHHNPAPLAKPPRKSDVTVHTSLPSHKYAAQLQLQKKTQDTQDTATLLYLLSHAFKKTAIPFQQHLRNDLNKGKGAQ